MTKQWKLLLSTAIPILVLFLPASFFPLTISVIEQRVMAIFLLGCFFWILEPIPVYATSVLIIVLELFMISDQSFSFLRGAKDDPTFGTALKYTDIMSTFSHPIILLFLGGFFLAMATTKYRLDINLTRIILKPFGSNPKLILLGLMIITGVFSMFMSNTACTAMMFAILAPVLKSLDENDRGRIAFILAIPFAANIGGIGTPIGTPPNAIALRYLTGEQSITFAKWMAFGVPYVIVVLAFSWLLLLILFPTKSPKIQVNIEGKFLTHWKAITTYVTFGGTIFLWMIGEFFDINSYVVAMIPVAVFSATQVINKEDLKTISWDVLWLVAGGFALGLALEKSGLSANVIQSIPFATFSPIFIVLLCAGICFLMSDFMSHTAATNLLLPIVAALGSSLPSLESYGGRTMLILAAAMTSSVAMILPISTPPNAIAYASGMIQTKHMSMAGLIIGLVGILALFLLMFILKTVHFF